MDIALAYNPATHCCDVVRQGGDFLLDPTPASAMLFSALANRRAKPDDTVPTTVPDWANPASFTARGGCPCDALSPTGTLTGSRLWLLMRAPAGQQTLINAQNDLAESMSWLEVVRGFALQIAVRYVAPQILGYLVRAGNTAVQLRLAVGG